MIGNWDIILTIGIYLYHDEGNLVYMCNEQPEKDENNRDTKSLEFAITLLAAFGSIAYATYTYFQTNPVSNLFYLLITVFSPALFILPMGLIVYVIIKGYLIECDYEDRKKLVKPLSDYYKHLYSMSILVLLFICLAILVQFFTFSALLISVLFVLYINNSLLIIAISLIILIGIYIIFFKHDYKKYLIKFIINSKKLIINLYMQNKNVLTIGLIFWFVLWPSATHALQGQITVDMESVYYKSDKQIPVSIQVTGPDTGFSVELSNTTESVNLNSIALIKKLEPYPNKKIDSDNSLIGYPLSSGKYIVFINTTNLSTGYYKLEFTRTKNKLSDAKGFYLSDDSKT